MKEDKRKICELLLQTLQSTREYRDLVDLEYHDNEYTDDAYIYARFACGSATRINVSLDSGSAMIRDILKCLA